MIRSGGRGPVTHEDIVAFGKSYGSVKQTVLTHRGWSKKVDTVPPTPGVEGPLKVARQYRFTQDVPCALFAAEYSKLNFWYLVVPVTMVRRFLATWEGRKPSFYEIVEDNVPARVALDIDGPLNLRDAFMLPSGRPITLLNQAPVIKKLEEEMTEVIHLLWPTLCEGGDVSLQLYISTAHRNDKFSMHIIVAFYLRGVEIFMPSFRAISVYMKLLVARPSSNDMYNQFKKAFDMCIYTPNRLFRVVFSTKYNRESPLLPDDSSSPHSYEHLILASNLGIDAPVVALTLPDDEGLMSVTPSSGGLLQTAHLPPYVREVTGILQRLYPITTFTHFKPQPHGGTLTFTLASKGPCRLYNPPREHHSNHIRMLFQWGAPAEPDLLLQTCFNRHGYQSQGRGSGIKRRADDDGFASETEVASHHSGADVVYRKSGGDNLSIYCVIPRSEWSEELQQVCVDARAPFSLLPFFESPSVRSPTQS